MLTDLDLVFTKTVSDCKIIVIIVCKFEISKIKLLTTFFLLTMMMGGATPFGRKYICMAALLQHIGVVHTPITVVDALELDKPE